jgi:putative RecB family exonuclease
MLTCGEQFRLTRQLHVSERPMWASIGGSAVHRMTEDYDRCQWAWDHDGPGPIGIESWDYYWDEALAEAMERNPEWDLEDYYRSGRVSKLWPKKEGPEWWLVNGPKFVKSWISWRALSGLEVWEYPDQNGELHPAIELEVWAKDDAVRCFIDRVFIDPLTDELHIVDLKSGSSTAAWPQQMIFNNLCLSDSLGARARWAGFWKARSGGVEKWHDLSGYPDEWVRDQVSKARTMRDLELFVAQPNNLCASACGVRQHCLAMGGTPPMLDQDATPAHNTGEVDE